MVRETQSMMNDRVTIVLGFAELLLEGTYGSLNERQKEALTSVVVAARDAKDILRERNASFVED